MVIFPRERPDELRDPNPAALNGRKGDIVMAVIAVILFGGGDGGGIKITDHGIERIPPFEPWVLAQFKAVNALVRVRSTELGTQAEQLAKRMTDQLVSYVQKASGTGSGAAIAFMDVDDGFVCGNGPHPHPFPYGLLSPLMQSAQLQQRQQLDLGTQARL
jgi:hypothetical protein